VSVRKDQLPIQKFLKQVMERRKQKPSQLAKALGTSHASVSRWLSGKDLPSVGSCCKLAEYSGASTEKILTIVGHIPAIEGKQSFKWPEFREYASVKYPEELDEDMIAMIEDLIERRRAKKRGAKKNKMGI
jgi:transcriptional regulator with XRE-family HTH domain